MAWGRDRGGTVVKGSGDWVGKGGSKGKGGTPRNNYVKVVRQK